MAITKKQLEFSAKNVKAFTGWLKRFSTIDNSVLLEVDHINGNFTAKVYNEERSVVKMSSIKFDEAGLLYVIGKTPLKETKRIKVGIFNIPRLIKIMDQFNDEEFSLTIEYQDLISDTETQLAGEKLLFKNKNLKMSVDCTSLNIFKYISDELFIGTIATINTIGKFELSKGNIEKINILNNLDNEHRFMEFKFKNKETTISGKTYDLFLDKNDIKEEVAISIFKDQYSTLDIEGYKVEMGEDRLVFHSNDSSTITVISRAEDKD
jgi:hypothetical protein